MLNKAIGAVETSPGRAPLAYKHVISIKVVDDAHAYKNTTYVLIQKKGSKVGLLPFCVIFFCFEYRFTTKIHLFAVSLRRYIIT